MHPSVLATTLPELITYAKTNPGKLNIVSAGNGSNDHLAGELFKMMAGVNMVHVPYRGGTPAMTDLLGGQIQVMVSGLPQAIEHIKSGRLRALAVTTTTRATSLPALPTVGDFVPGYESSTFLGLGAPKNTPMAILDKLNRETNTVLANDRMRKRLADLGAAPLPLSPVDFGKLITDETEKWGKVIRAANIKPE